MCIAYRRWEKYSNTLDAGWKSDPSFEKINLHRVLFCPDKSSSSTKDLVWSRKLADNCKRICWFPAGKSRCPGYHHCCSVHMLISPKAWPELLSLHLFQRENDSIIFMPETHDHARLSPHSQTSHFPLFESPNLLEFLQETCSSSRPKNVQKCCNSSSPQHTIYSHHLVHNLPCIFCLVAAPSFSLPLSSSGAIPFLLQNLPCNSQMDSSLWEQGTCLEVRPWSLRSCS